MNEAAKGKLGDISSKFMMPDYRQVVRKYRLDDQPASFRKRKGRMKLGPMRVADFNAAPVKFDITALTLVSRLALIRGTGTNVRYGNAAARG